LHHSFLLLRICPTPPHASHILCPYFLFYENCLHQDQHSFPTRRSSDLKKLVQKFGEEKVTEFVLKDAFYYIQKEASFSTNSVTRSEEHTSELQSRGHLVCRLLLEKKKTNHHLTFALPFPTNETDCVELD